MVLTDQQRAYERATSRARTEAESLRSEVVTRRALEKVERILVGLLERRSFKRNP